MKKDCDAVPALILIIMNLTWFSCACSSSNSLFHFFFRPLRVRFTSSEYFMLNTTPPRAVGPVVGITRYCSGGSHVNGNSSSFASRAFIKMIIYYLYAQHHKISFTSGFFSCMLRRTFFLSRNFLICKEKSLTHNTTASERGMDHHGLCTRYPRTAFVIQQVLGVLLLSMCSPLV